MARILRLRLKELLKERGMDQLTLSQRTGLTTRTISELCNNKVQRYPKKALEIIANELELKDINELLTFIEED